MKKKSDTCDNLLFHHALKTLITTLYLSLSALFYLAHNQLNIFVFPFIFLLISCLLLLSLKVRTLLNSKSPLILTFNLTMIIAHLELVIAPIKRVEDISHFSLVYLVLFSHLLSDYGMKASHAFLQQILSTIYVSTRIILLTNYEQRVLVVMLIIFQSSQAIIDLRQNTKALKNLEIKIANKQKKL